MSNTFDFNRFALLVKRQWQDFGRIYLITLLALSGVTVLLYLFFIPGDEAQKNLSTMIYSKQLLFRQPLFLALGFLFISVVSGSYFAAMGQKSRGTVELMVPASITEKYLCGIFYSSVLSIFSFLIVFLVTDLAFVNYLRSVQVPISAKMIKEYELANQTKFEDYALDYTLLYSAYNNQIVKAFYLCPFAVTSVYLLGSIYFNRFHYIKTSGALIAFGITVVACTKKLENVLTDKKMYIARYSEAGPEGTFIWSLLGTAAFTLIFWYIGYMRLKEKEV